MKTVQNNTSVDISDIGYLDTRYKYNSVETIPLTEQRNAYKHCHGQTRLFGTGLFVRFSEWVHVKWQMAEKHSYCLEKHKRVSKSLEKVYLSFTSPKSTKQRLEKQKKTNGKTKLFSRETGKNFYPIILRSIW